MDICVARAAISTSIASVGTHSAFEDTSTELQREPLTKAARFARSWSAALKINYAGAHGHLQKVGKSVGGSI